MKVTIWNAFASNNSGSYTIVGRFESTEVADAVARELAELFRAHAEIGDDSFAYELLTAWCLRVGVATDASHAVEQTWSGDWQRPPRAAAVGDHVVVHVEQTISMPRVIGEYFYRCGGRVTTELDHAHGPLQWTHTFWWRGAAADAAACYAAVADLFAADGPIGSDPAAAESIEWSWDGPAWGQTLKISSVWSNPIAAVAAVASIARRRGAFVQTRVEELDRAARGKRASFVPGSYDLVLTRLGPRPDDVVACLSRYVHGNERYELDVLTAVERLPFIVLRGQPRALVDLLRERLAAAGASSELVAATERD